MPPVARPGFSRWSDLLSFGVRRPGLLQGCGAGAGREGAMGGNYQKYLAEVFGTAVLVLIGCASIVAEGFGAAAPIGFIGIGMTFGMTVTAMAFAIGPVSGCHLNPSVTAAVWASGRMSANDAIGYIVAQLIGGIIGAGIL